MHDTPARSGLYFDDVQVGDSWDTAGVQVGETEMIGFAQEWDPQPFHIDKAAAQASVFGGLCASGLLTLLHSYRQFMGLRLFEGTTLAGLGMDQLRLHAPVFAADTLRVQITIARGLLQAA
jgi:acyl dehydratase